MIQTRDFTVKPQALGGNRMRFVASTAAVDAQRTRIMPRGCRLDRFKAAGSLPLLWAHKRDGAPDDVLGRVVDVEVSDSAVECTAEFEAHPRAQLVLGLVRRGTIRSCSIGFCDFETSEPDADGVSTIAAWTLCELSVCPVGANPEALAVRSFTVRAAAGPSQTRTHEPKPGRSRMNPLDKLGIAEGAKPEEVAAALIKYLRESQDSDEDKLACVVALLGMLAPAASDDGAEAAAKAAAEEVKALQARVAELEAQKTAPAETPEQQAERAIGAGRWPVGQRAALVAEYAAGRKPFLFAERTFAARHQTFTAGGKPVAAAQRQPNLGADTAAVEGRAAASTMAALKKMGLNVTADQFAAAQRAEQE